MIRVVSGSLATLVLLLVLTGCSTSSSASPTAAVPSMTADAPPHLATDTPSASPVSTSSSLDLEPPFANPRDLAAYIAQRSQAADWEALADVSVEAYGPLDFAPVSNGGGGHIIGLPLGYTSGGMPTDWSIEEARDITIAVSSLDGRVALPMRLTPEGHYLFDPGQCNVARARYLGGQVRGTIPTPSPNSPKPVLIRSVESEDVPIPPELALSVDCEHHGDVPSVTIGIFVRENLRVSVDLAQVVWDGSLQDANSTILLWSNCAVDAGKVILEAAGRYCQFTLARASGHEIPTNAPIIPVVITTSDETTTTLTFQASLVGEMYPPTSE